LQRFSEFKRPSRYGPLAAKRFAPAANQQSAAIVNNHPAHSDDGAFGVFA
jgi:hypothetical protein